MKGTNTEQQLVGAIVNTFRSNDLPARATGVVKGPHTLTVNIQLLTSRDSKIRRAEGLVRPVELAVCNGPVRISWADGILQVEVPRRDPDIVRGPKLKGKRFAAPLGITTRGNIVGVNLEEAPHVLFIGPTGCGKTTAIRAMAYHLARQNRPEHIGITICSTKPGDWESWRGFPHFGGLVTTSEALNDEIGRLSRKTGTRNQSGQWTRRHIVILDDLLNWLDTAPTYIIDSLGAIVSQARSAGIHLLIGTQRLGVKGAGSAVVSGNITCRIVFGTADASDAYLFTGRKGSGADNLGSEAGDALLISPGKMERLAVGEVTRDDLARLSAHIVSSRAYPVSPLPTRENDATAPAAPVTPETPETGDTAQKRVSSHVTSDAVTSSPRLSGKPSTPDEIRLVREIWKETGGKLNQTCQRLWGSKNSARAQWIKDIVQQEHLLPNLEGN